MRIPRIWNRYGPLRDVFAIMSEKFSIHGVSYLLDRVP